MEATVMFLRHPAVLAFLGGALAGAAIDLHAYGTSPEGSAFNWLKAVARWAAAGITPALAVAGLST